MRFTAVWIALLYAIEFNFTIFASSFDLNSPSIHNTEGWVPVTFDEANEHVIKPVSNSWKDATTEIFVGIIHYRDRRCSITLANLFKKAQHPDRIHVGVVEHIHTEQDSFSCIHDYCSTHKSETGDCLHAAQIKIIVLTHQDARGPNYARYMQQNLRNHEDFCLQVDAHSDFANNWDILLLEMWGNIGNEFAILSSTAPDISVLQNPDFNMESQQVPHLCQAMFDDRLELTEQFIDNFMYYIFLNLEE